MHAALSDRFQAGAVHVLATDGFAIEKTAQFATLLFGSPKAAKDGVKTLVVYAASEADPLGAASSASAATCPRSP